MLNWNRNFFSRKQLLFHYLLVLASPLSFHKPDNPFNFVTVTVYFKIHQSVHFPAANERLRNLSLASHHHVLWSLTIKLKHYGTRQRSRRLWQYHPCTSSADSDSMGLLQDECRNRTSLRSFSSKSLYYIESESWATSVLALVGDLKFLV